MPADKVSVKMSERFCFPDADVSFQSVDDVLFKAHRHTMSLCAPGFFAKTDTNAIDSEGIIHLPEKSALLELLFQHVYIKSRSPCLDDVAFDDLEALGDAAEKYRVFHAMNMCWIYMVSSMPRNPGAVLEYARRHGYTFKGEALRLFEIYGKSEGFSNATPQLVSVT